MMNLLELLPLMSSLTTTTVLIKITVILNLQAQLLTSALKTTFHQATHTILILAPTTLLSHPQSLMMMTP